MQYYLCLCVLVSAKFDDFSIKVLILKDEFGKYLLLSDHKLLINCYKYYYEKALSTEIKFMSLN